MTIQDPRENDPIPYTIECERRYYDYDSQCFVRDKWTSELKYDAAYVCADPITKEQTRGWWVYTDHHSYTYAPTSNISKSALERYTKGALPAVKTVRSPAVAEPYLSDAIRRRTASKTE